MATQKEHVTPKKIKKNGYPKKIGVLYCEGVYYCILEKWRTLLRTGLLMRFKHYMQFLFWGEQIPWALGRSMRVHVGV